jgi:hypothetical protein
MWSLRRTALGLFLGALAALVLFGCRAFEPEVVIVNNPPNTFLTGAPAETTGGYFHFHVYWYGSDTDGTVERFVWALTDTSVQDIDTPDDEEDQRFNPALNISTLDIGHWTTRTDTVFDFSLDQGSVLAYDMTLHMVAVDDRGDFDRTPARLHFISNALGNPRIHYRKLIGPDQWAAFADSDTIAYGEPFTISWYGETPNIRSFTQSMLVALDTVPEGLPADAPRDGLLGFKFRLPEVECDESSEDCWNPRYWDDASGDSLSYFGTITQRQFRNDDSGIDIYGKRLTSGMHELRVNTIDVAGVEVPSTKQILHVVVNYDPDTHLLKGETDPLPGAFPGLYSYDDPRIYPYYRVFNPDGTIDEFTFAEADTVPDRAYAVFKAIGHDDPRDLKIDPAFGVTFQASSLDTGLYNLIAPYRFTAEYGDAHRTLEWQPDYDQCTDCWSADTLGFEVGPFRYRFRMRTVDEQGKRDGTEDSFFFYGNFPPCVQCVELFNYTETSTRQADDDCWDADCASTVDEIYGYNPLATPPTGYHLATVIQQLAQFYYKLQTGEVWLDRPLQLAGVDSVFGTYYGYKLWLHGREEHPQLEPALVPQDRVMSWKYEITYAADGPQGNIIRDGGGADNLLFPTRNFSRTNPDAPIYIDDSGVWIMKVRFFAPLQLVRSGRDAYWQSLYDFYNDTDMADEAFALTTIQLGDTKITVKARDASNCDWRSDAAEYHYYRGVRPPSVNCPAPQVHCLRKCDESYANELGRLDLDLYAFESEKFIKHYRVKVVTPTGVFPE